jgi:hypothetical protein
MIFICNIVQFTVKLTTCPELYFEFSSFRVCNIIFLLYWIFNELETTLTNQNCFYEGIKSRFNWKNACLRSVQNILSYNLLSEL